MITLTYKGTVTLNKPAYIKACGAKSLKIAIVRVPNTNT